MNGVEYSNVVHEFNTLRALPSRMAEDYDVRKIAQIGADSNGVTLPKEQLREEGVLDEDDELVKKFARVEKTGSGEWSVELL